MRNGGAIFDTNGFNVTVPQVLAHSNFEGDNAIDGGLTKNGTGGLTLTANNTYTGRTFVTSGMLYVNNVAVAGGDSGTGSGPVFVGVNAWLGGNGTIAGDVTVGANPPVMVTPGVQPNVVASRGTLTPGVNGAGVLTIGASLTLTATAAYAVDLSGPAAGSGYDQTKVGGKITIDGILSLTRANSFHPVVGEKFFILDLTSDGGVTSGLFANATADDHITDNLGNTYLINYADNIRRRRGAQRREPDPRGDHGARAGDVGDDDRRRGRAGFDVASPPDGVKQSPWPSAAVIIGNRPVGMTPCIALLRGVNVGGKRKLSMAGLQAGLVDMGFTEVRTLLNSGNVVFRSAGQATSAALETFLETEIARRLDLRTDVHVRTADEWRAIIAANPLPDLAVRVPGHLILACLKTVPSAAGVETLRAAHPGPEVIHVDGRQLYIDYSAHGIGASRLTAALMDGILRTRGTGRNWNTVLKLAALAGV